MEYCVQLNIGSTNFIETKLLVDGRCQWYKTSKQKTAILLAINSEYDKPIKQIANISNVKTRVTLW